MDKRRQRIRNLMDEKGYSYRDLEAQTGISGSVLQRYVTGKTNKMSIDYFELIAKALGVSPSDLMGWTAPIEAQLIYGHTPEDWHMRESNYAFALIKSYIDVPDSILNTTLNKCPTDWNNTEQELGSEILCIYKKYHGDFTNANLEAPPSSWSKKQLDDIMFHIEHYIKPQYSACMRALKKHPKDWEGEEIECGCAVLDHYITTEKNNLWPTINYDPLQPVQTRYKRLTEILDTINDNGINDIERYAEFVATKPEYQKQDGTYLTEQE